MAPMRAAATMISPIVPWGGSMIPLPTVSATFLPKKAPKRFATAAMSRATLGVSARVETEVAMALAESWNPLV